MVEDYVAKVKELWSLSGCTLMSDIWTDIKGRSFINVVAYSPKGPIFLKSFERSSHKNSGSFLRDLLVSVIEEIGPKNVVQIITDNASNYGLAGDMIMGSYPYIYKIKCAAHGVQLLFKDIYNQVQWISKVFDKAKEIVDYMCRHTIVLSLMREHTYKDLKRYSKTRFASHFLMLQSVLEAEDGLRNLIASVTWRNLSYSKGAMAQNVKNIIQGIEFWKEGKEVISSLESLVKILRLVDSDGSIVGCIYDAIERARIAIKKQCETNPIKYMQLRDLFETRQEENILHEIHAVAAYLNPYLMYGMKISASACERNWSAFDAAQTKKRNRLSPNMLEDLVYIRVNSLMLKNSTNFEIHDKKVIDLENIVELDENVNERLEVAADEGLEENATDNIDVGDTS
ncbi:uncharacterized protein LOC127812758 [Diospyros lotus]|uniref:uncharacterized protein LOC127812758 n=1 Tax=Diospyros lotus TaxID=55363 RepID=UPI00224F9E44|nr:uncharacterized protein LOC127812758 [Diospyros lotus]